MNSVYISIGSNLGDKKLNLKNAIKKINEKTKASEIIISSIYKTTPVGFESENFFYNGVIKIVTPKQPNELLTILKSIEKEMGRSEKISEIFQDRIIDIDIILFNEIVLNSHELIIPHPEFTKRLFVLIPLLELEPKLLYPENNTPIKDFLLNNSFLNQTLSKINF
ncbi:2-amino-4-hydroxy-6-hydroxymethyldihydropteridine diphosphokinase [Candidatus Dependentiae bacterium]|nr:2-amino-4-hydroxy-6-hydroxymethyldihydropteridine diphosphokinase [Candidatus Dependentiae bacterium]